MERNLFIQGMSHAACTVSVVTTDGLAGRAGVTVSAMCSVSADPPSLLVCVHHKSSACDVIQNNGVFCLNVLRDEQSYVSDTFGGRIKPPGSDKFSCAQWYDSASGAPALVDALVVFDCEIRKTFRWGSHMIFIADTGEIHLNRQGNPLIYANRAYGVPRELDATGSENTIKPPPKEQASRKPVLSIGSFGTLGPFLTSPVLAQFQQQSQLNDIRLTEGDQTNIIEGLLDGSLDVGLVYSGEFGDEITTTTLFETAPYVLLPQQHALYESETVSLHDLINYPMVLLDLPSSSQYFTSLFIEHGIEPWIAYRAPSFETVRAMVANGFGYSILVTKPANSMSYDGGSLAIRTLKETVTPGRVALASATSKMPLTGVAGKFRQFCIEYFNQNSSPA